MKEMCVLLCVPIPAYAYTYTVQYKMYSLLFETDVIVQLNSACCLAAAIKQKY